MLGKLGRFLRILGFDTLIASPKLSDNEIMQRGLDEQRIVVTKDKEFFERLLKKTGNVVFITQSDLDQQLIHLFKELGIKTSQFDPEKPKSFIKRCSVCNSLVRQVDKSLIKGLVNDGTYRSYDMFWQCSSESCKNVFWIGSHWNNIKNTINRVNSNDN